MEIAGNDIEIYAYSDLLMGATAYGIAHAESTWTWSYANQQPTDDLNVHDNRIECVFNDVSTFYKETQKAVHLLSTPKCGHLLISS